MSCATKRIANILNDLPLSIQKSSSEYPDIDFLSPITPNMLTTGRSGSRAPVERDYAGEERPEERLSYIQELERAWWYQYKVQYFTSLIPCQKWLTAKRNMCVGDVVLIEYKNKSFPGTYRLGRIKDFEIDPTDNLVRTCTVIYKLVKSSLRNLKDVHKDVISKEVCVPVQRLVLILPLEDLVFTTVTLFLAFLSAKNLLPGMYQAINWTFKSYTYTLFIVISSHMY